MGACASRPQGCVRGRLRGEGGNSQKKKLRRRRTKGGKRKVLDRSLDKVDMSVLVDRSFNNNPGFKGFFFFPLNISLLHLSALSS